MAKNTKDLIYHGALEAFAQWGIGETTMDRIAKKAGVAKGTLYYNFKTKEDLFIYVMKRGIHQMAQVLQRALSHCSDRTKKWEHVVESQLAFFECNRSFARVLLQNIWGANVQERVPLQELLGDYFYLLDDELLRLQKEGELPEDLDIQALSGALFGMLTVPAARAILRNQPICEAKRVRTVSYLVERCMGRGI